MNYRFFSALLILLWTTYTVQAQRTQALQVGINAAYYSGDLTEGIKNAVISPGITLGYQVYVAPMLSARIGFSYGTVGASDEKASIKARINRNLQFKSPIVEGSLVAVWDIIPDKNFRLRWKRGTHFSPYVFGGVGLFYFNPQAELEGKTYSLQPLGTEGQYIIGDGFPEPYQRTQINIPVGVGMNIRFSHTLGIGLEAGYRRTFTDYIDDVSTIYPDPDQLLEASGSLALALSNRSNSFALPGDQRGNPGIDDHYVFLSVILFYYLRE